MSTVKDSLIEIISGHNPSYTVHTLHVHFIYSTNLAGVESNVRACSDRVQQQFLLLADPRPGPVTPRPAACTCTARTYAGTSRGTGYEIG
jgi:hypothetical protein